MTEQNSRESAPSIELFSNDTSVSWTPRPDLLDTAPDDRNFVVEIDDEGSAHLRFSADFDGRPDGGTALRAQYRIGNGRTGNVGAEAITVVVADEAALGGSALKVRNPLAAAGGTNAESVAEAKQFAPSAFRVRRERAVIAEDYAELLARDFEGDVQGAASALRWNGSWYEARTGIDARGQEQAAVALVRRARGRLHRYRRIGHDLRVESARLVPLSVAMDVCVSPRYLRAAVLEDLRDLFSSRRLKNGQLGYFHPDRLRYGESVKVSALVAAAYDIPGIASLAVTRLERLDEGPNQELENGLLPLGPLEIAQVDSDPVYPDRGSITFTVRGGR
jgi:predicted phage baseplate assembly protein